MNLIIWRKHIFDFITNKYVFNHKKIYIFFYFSLADISHYCIGAEWGTTHFDFPQFV